MIRVRNSLVLAVALLLGFSWLANAVAQAPAEGERSGRRGPRMSARRGSFTGLLRAEAVRKELKLS